MPVSDWSADKRRVIPCLLFIALLLHLSGCSYIPWFGDEEEVVIELREPVELTEFDPQVQILQNWQVSLGGNTEKTRLQLYPHVHADKIAFTETDGRLSVYEQSTGRLLHSVNTIGSVAAGVGGNNSHLVVGSLDGDVAAYDQQGATQIWSVNVGSEVVAIAHSQSDQAVIRTNDNRILALSMNTGEQLWTVAQTPPALTLRGASKPLILDRVVYAGLDNGEVIAISMDSGSLIWESRVSVPSGRSELDRLVDIDGQLAADEEFIYAASYHGRTVAISRVNGRIIWARDIASIAGVSVDESLVYVTDRDDNIWALEKATGVSVWKQEKFLYRQLSAPVVQDNAILVGDGQGYLHALSRQNGSIIGRTKLGKNPIHVSAMSTRQSAYVMDSNGRMASISLVTIN